MPDLILFLIAISYFVFIVSIKVLMYSMDISRRVKINLIALFQNAMLVESWAELQQACVIM